MFLVCKYVVAYHPVQLLSVDGDIFTSFRLWLWPEVNLPSVEWYVLWLVVDVFDMVCPLAADNIAVAILQMPVKFFLGHLDWAYSCCALFLCHIR